MNAQSVWCFLIILFAFGLFVWKYYWKLQIMYNSASLSLYTPKNFGIVQAEKYTYLTNLGQRYAKTQKIVIAGLLRDVRDRLPIIEKRAESLGNMFLDYRILIVENDSKDGTREYLLSWTKRNPKVTILGCGENVKECTLNLPASEGHSVYRSRIEKMAFLRNIYLQEVRKRYSDFDFLTVWDMDIVGSIYLDGVANSMGYFAIDPSLGAMCAYGIYQWGPLKLYYDTYATLESGDSFHIKSKAIHDLKKGLGMQFRRGESPIKIVSCFSGFSIYRLQPILRSFAEYGTTSINDVSGNLECEHVFFHSQLNTLIKMNPSMIHLVIQNN